MLILTKYIAKHELKPLGRFFGLQDILNGAEKVNKGLAKAIKSPGSNEGFRFFKVRIGKRIAGRMIVFLVTSSNKIVPVLIRLKKDKIFGMNASMNNAKVVAKLKENLEAILMDIEQGKYEEFSFTN